MAARDRKREREEERSTRWQNAIAKWRCNCSASVMKDTEEERRTNGLNPGTLATTSYLG
jgi:hypothetical protein